MAVAGVKKKMIFLICILAAAFAVANIIYHFITQESFSLEFLPFLIGVAMGAALNIIKLILIERVVTKVTQNDNTATTAYVYVQYLIRFLLTALVLVAAVFFDFVSIWGVVAGIMTMPIAGYSMGFSRKQEVSGQAHNNQE